MDAVLPPGPTAPSVVQLLRFVFTPQDFFDECAKRYGDPFTVRLGAFGTFVMAASPELVKQIFTADGDTLVAGKANRDLIPFVGTQSLLTLDGGQHLRHRRLLLPPFHGERMRAYAQVMAEGARAMVAKMPLGEPFSMHPLLQELTLEVILRAVFGLEEGARKRRMFELLVEFLQPPSPLLLYLPQVDVPFSPYRAFLRKREAVDQELRATVEERRSALAKQGPGVATDILSLLLSARDEAGEPLTEGELRDELMTLLIAGHETTATSLAWAFERVLATPSVAHAIDRELEQCGGSLEALAASEYLDGVVRETLRTRSLFAAVVRETKVPWRLGTWDLPAGVRISPCIHLAHHNPERWPAPKAFRPERFVGAKVDPYSWFPFGGGARRCVGLAFALYEMKIVLGTVFRHARMQLASGRPAKIIRRAITLAPEGGTRVVLK